jgi:CubicO group peptidase (beta-lactamase class C family)
MILSLVLGLVATSTAQTAAPERSAKLDAYIAPVETGSFEALVVSTVADGEVRTRRYGPRADAVDKTTPFEIGSVSMAFTGLLLAEAVRRGEVQLEDPAEKHIPLGDGRSWPTQADARPITLLDLATHTSGLPPMPAGFEPADPADPYAGLTWSDLASQVAETPLEAAPGETWAPSPLGVALLGKALENAGEAPYATLLQDRIVAPLGMEAVSVDGPGVHRSSTGTDWTLGPYAPAAGIHASARDLTRLAALVLQPSGPLAPSVSMAVTGRKTLGAHGSIGLLWNISPQGVVWQNGQTGGAHAVLAIAPERRIAVIALGDAPTDLIDQIGFGALEIAAGEQPEPLNRP